MKIKINGSYYLYFNEFTLSSSLDSVAATFSFTAKYDPKDPQVKELFRPLTFYPVEFLTDEGQLIFSGTIVNHDFNSESQPDLVILSGYSKGGVLEDCTIPYDAYPLESLNRSLKDIATRLLKYFNLNLKIYDNVKDACNQIYPKSVADPSGSVKDYLAKLAAQKNVILSHDTAGNVIMFRPDAAAKSKGVFTRENSVNMGLNVSGQSIHSVLTSLRQPSKRNADALEDEETTQLTGAQTIKNPLVKAFRPYVQILSSGNLTDTDSGVKNAFAAELKNIKVGFGLQDWYDISIGDIIEVENDEIYISKRARLMVAATSKSESSTGRTMSIVAVLPETFTGNAPKNIFT